MDDEWTIFGKIADVASIVGLVLTLYVVYKLRQLWKEYAVTERVPREAVRLRNAATKLSLLLKPNAPRMEVLNVLAEIKVVLESIARNIGTDHNTAYVELKTAITRLERENPLDQRKLEHVYRESYLLAGRAESLAEDRKQRLSP